MDKIIAVVMMTFAFGFLALPVSIYMLLATNIYYTVFMMLALVVLYVVLVLRYVGFFKTAMRKKIVSAMATIMLAVSAVPAAMHYYKESIPTVGSEVNIFEYIPFESSNKLVELGEEANIKLEEPLPILDGATAMFPIYAAAVQATYPERPDYYDKQILQMTTTPDAYKNLVDGQVDIIFVGPPSEQQKNMAASYGKTFNLTPIGKEAFVFFVHKNNPIDSLTIAEIQQIYSGEIKNWSQLGGEDEEIRAFQRPQDSGSQTALQSLMGDIPIMEAPVEDVTSGMGGIIEEVSQYRNYGNAIGYSFRYYTTEMIGNDDIKLLAIEGIEPTKDNIGTGEYPIASEFFAITAGTTNPNVDKFLQWMTSKQGQKLVEKVGYVPVFE